MSPIIITLDRHGLTKSHLQKHKIPATKFIERVVAQRLSPEPATKYQKRIEKYGGRLFTFLDYNGVTRNNNNAEHANKGFARDRRFADGRFTGKSVTDYLAILSVFSDVRISRLERVEIFALRQYGAGLTFSASVLKVIRNRTAKVLLENFCRNCTACA